MLSSVKEKTEVLEEKAPNLEKNSLTAQQATRILFRINHLMAHMGLGEDFNKALGILQRMVFTTRMLLMSLNFLSMTTGYGMIMGLFGMATVGIAIREEVVDIAQQWGSTQ